MICGSALSAVRRCAGTTSPIRTRGAMAAGRKWTPMDNLLTDKDLETIARAHRRC